MSNEIGARERMLDAAPRLPRSPADAGRKRHAAVWLPGIRSR